MKRIAVAAAMLAVASMANASLSFSQLSSGRGAQAFDVASPASFAVASSSTLGNFVTDPSNPATVAFRAQESGFVSASLLNTNENALGTISFSLADNALPLSYTSDGGYWASNTSSGLMRPDGTFGNTTYANARGHDNSADAEQAGKGDNLVTRFSTAQAPVPKIETYAMLMAGLSLMGWTIYRKRNRNH